MPAQRNLYFFTTLAMNQTLFFAAIAEELQKRGHQVMVICFHERSHDELLKRGIPSYNIFDHIRENPIGPDLRQEYQKVAKKFNFPDTQKIFSHEKFSFELSDENEIIRKFVEYSLSLENCIKAMKLKFDGPAIMVQELGGFSSLLSAFYVSRALGMDHYFLEPAFFKGRCFLIKNDIESLNIAEPSAQVSPELEKYIQSAVSNKNIVIPDKDRKHYLGLFAKIVNFYNFKRFIQKLTDKYISGKREEFQYIGMYTMRHLRMFWNKFQLSGSYEVVPKKKFIYFPLHVPMDVALTIRSPHCLDQYHLIDLICRLIPFGYKLVIKEHPAMVGVLNLQRMKQLLKDNQNLAILKPSINNYDVLGKADLIVTVNSKSGAEALMIGRKVMVLGDAFYRNCSLVKRAKDWSMLDVEIQKSLQEPAPMPEPIKHYFQSVWNRSFPGEIYKCSPENISSYVENLLASAQEAQT